MPFPGMCWDRIHGRPSASRLSVAGWSHRSGSGLDSALEACGTSLWGLWCERDRVSSGFSLFPVTGRETGTVQAGQQSPLPLSSLLSFVLLQELQEWLGCSGRSFPAAHSPGQHPALLSSQVGTLGIPLGQTLPITGPVLSHLHQAGPEGARSCRQPQQTFCS